MDNGCVLIVEDDREINSLIGAYVELSGLAACHAYDGLTGVDMAARKPVRAVVLDLMLPDIDGFEVCRRLRASAKTAETPVIILSAMGTPEHRRHSSECGANAHLTKPFDPDEFTRVLKQYTNGHSSNGHPKP